MQPTEVTSRRSTILVPEVGQWAPFVRTIQSLALQCVPRGVEGQDGGRESGRDPAAPVSENNTGASGSGYL